MLLWATTLSERFVEHLVLKLDGCGFFPAVDEMISFLEPLLFADLFERVSTEIVRGFGRGIGAISIASTSLIRLQQVEVGDIVVGRVMVDVIMYEIVPRSNYDSLAICRIYET